MAYLDSRTRALSVSFSYFYGDCARPVGLSIVFVSQIRAAQSVQLQQLNAQQGLQAHLLADAQRSAAAQVADSLRAEQTAFLAHTSSLEQQVWLLAGAFCLLACVSTRSLIIFFIFWSFLIFMFSWLSE